ncbi:dipeptidase, putative [Pilibacter termitis]|uniref:Dipeptidase, putative n=1 Tax=Pilibacter termitis TaxID=263852 RepID=A0A1T4QDW9_9ENTE|nr:Sapep family Mn(2+)-dependent dipeptidase [Pilibacter termitis]SKA02003.1 dipeptidase, putative [Pilibacter termitis]
MIESEVFLSGLDRLLKIPSVREVAEEDAPFGKQSRMALEEIVKIARELGFQARMVKNVAAVVEYGYGEEYFGIFGHLDVVPAGCGWSVPPYQLNDCGEKFIARGVLDNKGPIFTCLYALWRLKEEGFTPVIPIRIVFGSSEETGSEDMSIYLENEPPALFGFTPDGKFPAIYGERGLVNFSIRTTLDRAALKNLSEISGDQSRAFVPDHLSVSYNQKEITALGKKAPSNAPELGENAITLLAKKLLEEKLPEKLREYFTWLVETMHEKHFGEGLGLDFSDEESGKTIITPVNFQKYENALEIELAVRYPVTVSEEELTHALEKHLPSETQVEVVRRIPGVVKDKNQWWIQELSKIYEDFTGLSGKPTTTTGATYARSVPNIIAFGPSFPGQKGIAHNADEYMLKEDFEKLYEIYKESIKVLSSHQF